MVYSTRRFVVCLSVCHFVLVFFSPFSIAITSLGEESFSYVCSVCACLDLSVFSSFWGLGRAAVCDCGTPWTFLLPFFIQKVEMVQGRSIHWICNSLSNYDSVTAMRSDLGIMSLEQGRVDASVIMLYTIIHGIVAISLPVHFEQTSRQTRHSHPLAFHQVHTIANYYKYSFPPCL